MTTGPESMAFTGPTPGLPQRRSAPVLGDPAWSVSEATRYLCVGAYLDRDFRRRVLQEVLGARHRAVAPSYGIDIVPVLRHCIRAQGREFARNSAFVFIFVVMICLAPEMVTAGLFLGWMLRQWVLGIRTFLNGQFVRSLLHQLASGAAFFVVMSVLAYSTQSASLSGNLTSFDSNVWTLLGRTVGTFLVLWGSAWGVRLAELVINHRTILSELSSGRFVPSNAPQEPARYASRIEFLAQAQSGNVTYYSRAVADRPFVGSGHLEEPWRLAVPLKRVPDTEIPAEELTVQALYRSMRKAMASLAGEDIPPDQRVVGLSMQPRLFVPGLLRRQDGLLDERDGLPRHHLLRAELDGFEQHDRNRATEYLTARIGAWEGELEVTIFLYFSIRGGTLYMEFVGAALPSIRELYHSVDSYQQLQPTVYAQLGLTALGGLPMMLVRSPLDLFRLARDRVREHLTYQGESQDIGSRLAFDYGVRTSVRELGADYDSEQFFQRLDGQRYIFLVERRVRDEVARVLDHFGYSSEEFMARTETIINNTTQINGGTFNTQGGAIAVGAYSQATTTPVSPTPAYLPPRQPAPGRHADRRGSEA